MKIIFTKNFLKTLSKVSSITKDDIISLLLKYPNTNNLVLIDDLGDSKIFKGYLLSKKVRILFLLQVIKGKFIPVYIVKKETKKGRNITKENYIDLFGKNIDKTIENIDKLDYEEIDLKS